MVSTKTLLLKHYYRRQGKKFEFLVRKSKPEQDDGSETETAEPGEDAEQKVQDESQSQSSQVITTVAEPLRRLPVLTPSPHEKKKKRPGGAAVPEPLKRAKTSEFIDVDALGGKRRW